MLFLPTKATQSKGLEFLSKQWAAVRIWYRFNIDPPQWCRYFLRPGMYWLSETIKGHFPDRATFPPIMRAWLAWTVCKAINEINDRIIIFHYFTKIYYVQLTLFSFFSLDYKTFCSILPKSLSRRFLLSCRWGFLCFCFSFFTSDWTYCLLLSCLHCEKKRDVMISLHTTSESR